VSPPRELPARSIRFVAVLAALLLGFIAAGSWLKRLAVRPPEVLPDLGAAPAFAARDASGRTWTAASFAGAIWVADALPPSCAACAVRSLRMTDLQTSVSRARGVRLATFVSEPALASSEKLRALARAFGADEAHWVFLAGHSPFPEDRFALVDGAGRLRGLYAESDPAVASELLDGVGDLLRERHR